MYGVLAPQTLPEQDPGLILILAERWMRSQPGHEKWATIARECVDMVEGRQWDANTLREMARQKRPAIKLNKIYRQLRLVLGYFENNPNSIKYLPGHDGSGSETTAEVLNRLSKQIDELNDMQFIETEVFLDGLTTGRGYFDSRIDFDENEFGEIRDRARDPFWIYLDPDGEDYDLNSSSYVVTKRITSLDEVEFWYGRDAMQTLSGFVGQGGDALGSMVSLYENADVAPIKGFGSMDNMDRWMQQIGYLYGDLVDPFRKDITVLDFQYWVRRMSRFFVDLETGDREVIPDEWPDEKIAKVLYYAESKGQYVKVVRRPHKALRWTTLAGPIMVYDRELPCFDSFSLTPYFPYFRRGQTRGMVEDLLDPQREVNKRRSARIEILAKTANGGWLIHEQGISETEEAKLSQYGSTPGVKIKWKGEGYMKPQQIVPEVATQRLEKLERDADADFGEISGINEAALGDNDPKVQSGRAIEARQRQAVVSVQMYISNRNRTIQLFGKKRLSLIKKHYTEKRIIRTIGENGKPELTTINNRDAAPQIDPKTGAMIDLKNDVTIGKYSVAVDETPISATFLSAQFDEALMLLEKMGIVGQQLMQSRPDLLIDMSSLPRKKEWIAAIQQAMGAVSENLGAPVAGADGTPVAPGTPAIAAPAIDEGVQGPGSNIVKLMPTGQPAA